MDEVQSGEEASWNHFLVDQQCRGDTIIAVLPRRRSPGPVPFRVYCEAHSKGRGQPVENIPPRLGGDPAEFGRAAIAKARRVPMDSRSSSVIV